VYFASVEAGNAVLRLWLLHVFGLHFLQRPSGCLEAGSVWFWVAGLVIFNVTVFGLQGAKCLLPSASGLGEQFAVQGQNLQNFPGDTVALQCRNLTAISIAVNEVQCACLLLLLMLCGVVDLQGALCVCMVLLCWRLLVAM
jgi:hypothetical protein